MQHTISVEMVHEPEVNVYRELVRKMLSKLDYEGYIPVTSGKNWFKTSTVEDSETGRTKTTLKIECRDDLIVEDKPMRRAQLRYGETGYEVVTENEVFHLCAGTDISNIIEWLYNTSPHEFYLLGLLSYEDAIQLGKQTHGE